MAKLKISDAEVALMKGLIAYEKLNDQQVLAIFSHLSRNFNSREMGWIRNGGKPRYKAIKAAGAEEVADFLEQYSKVEEVVERIGIYAVSDEELSAYQALDYARSAVAIFNNNTLLARSQIFVVLMVVAWTYLAHARLRKEDIDPVYKNDAGDPVMIDGKPKHWELSYCITRPELALTEGEKNNLRFITLLRNEIEHRATEDINSEVQSKLQANALNFVRFARKSFGRRFDLSRDFSFAIQLQALNSKQNSILKASKGLSKSVAVVNALVEKEMSSSQFNDPEYAFRVYVVPNVVNNEKKADQAVIFSPVGSSVEMAIKQVEKPKYRMKEVVKLLQDDGVANANPQSCINAWQQNDLKNPGKGFAIELGGQWFWYPEGVDAIKAALTA
ncbi:DUF3644 domain-containing protein [Qipengyuania marisflavi]|uniref:DUF3644 domain-containing protein n=1 Tax=Qipengyuania marisflavi TaxID=2486356 RepID=A0A5S3PES7_9SPHN|nr:DUF3644 domain-containing protein [Qipengyuania marisflavi]TMM50090.1 DUF3644 domain-containing protein [Qipengyuania marisflavi]